MPTAAIAHSAWAITFAWNHSNQLLRDTVEKRKGERRIRIKWRERKRT
jgi:hypothetical protein